MDADFDVLVVGGGSKGLITAMYLAKYGGMSVGIFERLHEIGGAWCDEEAAPGFISDTCSTEIWPYYHEPVKADFPDFEEKGAKIVYGKVSQAGAYLEDDSCLLLYHPDYDPTRERTVASIARFSERDAEFYMELWGLWQRGLRDALIEIRFNPPPPPGKSTPLARVFADPKNRGIMDPHVNTMSLLQAGRVVWDSKEIISYVLRRSASAGIDPNEPNQGIVMYTTLLHMPEAGGTAGGSHNTAHAAHHILLEHGAKFFTGSEVDKVLMENGVARGIKLVDGTEVRAGKLVLTDVDPQQLCLRLIGREHLDPHVARKIEALESWRACGSWFQWALREPPEYKAAQFNPDVNGSTLVVLTDRNLQRYVWAYAYRSMGLPIPEPVFMVYSHPYDKARCPEGRWVGLTESPETAATNLTEEQWRAYKKEHANYVIDTWSKYAPNVNWDNVLGYIPITPYDLAQHKINMGPNGNWFTLDAVASQDYRNRPIPEMADHRTPIENLYATGVAWGSDYVASSGQGYSCYKVIAKDMGLRKPWEEQGRPW
ncbi:phytoene desaturase family protein [Chloroflexota bacterium]